LAFGEQRIANILWVDHAERQTPNAKRRISANPFPFLKSWRLCALA
jgi:hypothetical protein